MCTSMAYPKNFKQKIDKYSLRKASLLCNMVLKHVHFIIPADILTRQYYTCWYRFARYRRNCNPSRMLIETFPHLTCYTEDVMPIKYSNMQEERRQNLIKQFNLIYYSLYSNTKLSPLLHF